MDIGLFGLLVWCLLLVGLVRQVGVVCLGVGLWVYAVGLRWFVCV